MQKKFLANLGILMFLNLLIKPFWVLGIDRSVQNAVGSEEFGFYFSILNFSYLFTILLDLGITNFNNRNIAQNTQLLNKHFSSILALKMLLGVFYLVFLFIVGFVIGYDARQFYLLGWIVLNQFMLSFIFYLRSNITGLLMFKYDSVLSVLDRLLMIIICSVLLWGNITRQSFQIEWFVYAQTVAYTLTALTAILIVMRKAAFRRLNWNLPFLIMILKKSYPYALLILLMAQYNRIDTVVIERLLPDDLGKVQAGIYAQAYRLLDAAMMIAFLFSVLLLPLFSRMIKLKQPIEKLVKLSFSLLFTVSVITSAATWFYSTEMMIWLYPQHPGEAVVEYTQRIADSAHIFKILMICFVGLSTTYVFGTLLTANGSLKHLNIVAASGVLISLVINFILVPRMLAIGSAYASLSAQMATAVAQVFVALYIFRFRINYRFLVSLTLFTVGVFVLGHYSRSMEFDWRLNVLIFGGGSLLLAVVLGMLNIPEFIRTLRTEKA